jgi:hypothetical protein
MIISSDACTINVLLEHNRQLIDDSVSIIDDSRVMLQLLASLTINILLQYRPQVGLKTKTLELLWTREVFGKLT